MKTRQMTSRLVAVVVSRPISTQLLRRLSIFFPPQAATSLKPKINGILRIAFAVPSVQTQLRVLFNSRASSLVSQHIPWLPSFIAATY
jgi:hypothetical protein